MHRPLVTNSGLALAGLLSIQALPAQAALASAYSGRGAHPGFAISAIEAMGAYSTMGLGWLSNGDMVWVRAPNQYVTPPGPNANASVWIASGMSGVPTLRKITDMLRQPTGVAVGPNDEIVITDLDGIYKVTNLNPTATGTNKTLVLAAPATTPALPYHAYIFCPIYYNGMYYAPYSGTFVPGGYAESNPNGPYTGAVLAWKPDGSGGFTKYAGGLRSPNGGGAGPNGIMMFTDNQGSWNPSCALNIIKADRFYGTHQVTGFTDNWAGAANKAGTLPYQPPVAWFPQAVAQSVGGAYAAGESTAQPLYMDHGPYQGDWVMGDCTLEGISRVALDPVNGGTGVNANYNGSVHWFTNIGSGSAPPAPNRLTMDPKADIVYVGTLGTIGTSLGAWPTPDRPQPFYKIVLDGAAIKASFEMLSVKSRAGGIEIKFSQPVSAASAVAGSFAFKQWDMKRQDTYGGGNDVTNAPAITSVQVSEDGNRVFLGIGNHAKIDRVLSIIASGIRSRSGNASLVFNQAWFTHNYQSTVPFDPAKEPVGIADRSGEKFMSDRVLHTVLPGAVKLRVDLKGEYTISLGAFNGARVEEKRGFDPGEFTLKAPGRGLYVVRVDQHGRSYARPVAF